jgi:hypothetical protein
MPRELAEGWSGLHWFHVAMRLRVMRQMAKGLVNEQNMMSAQEPITEAGEELDTVDIGMVSVARQCGTGVGYDRRH